jgi:hypothetical protein
VRIETQRDVFDGKSEDIRDCSVCDCSIGPDLSRTSRMYSSSCSLGKATLPGSEKLLRSFKTDNDAFAQLSNYL